MKTKKIRYCKCEWEQTDSIFGKVSPLRELKGDKYYCCDCGGLERKPAISLQKASKSRYKTPKYEF